jgi:hypothetical protein
MPTKHPLAVLLTASAIAACGGSTPPNNDVARTDAADGATASGLPGDQYCTTGTQPNCAAPARATCGVCVTPPDSNDSSSRLARTPCASLNGAHEYCDSANPPAAPNLGCFANPPAAQTSQMVTVWGVVHVFGTGGDSQHVRVEMLRVNADGSPGALVGMAVSDTSAPYHEEEDQLDSSGNVTQHRVLGAFQIPNVPTETPLIVRTQGDPSDPTAARDLWAHPLVDYTLPIRNRDIMPAPATTGITGAAIKIRPRVLSNADWSTIPSTATLTGGIPMGQGALAGEVHDCDDVRLSNATVYAAPAPNFSNTIYFSDNETNPLPDLSRLTRGTSILGLYAMLSMNPGQVRVAAVGYDPTGNLVHVGSYTAQVFANSVTVVTMRGVLPWQVSH